MIFNGEYIADKLEELRIESSEDKVVLGKIIDPQSPRTSAAIGKYDRLLLELRKKKKINMASLEKLAHHFGKDIDEFFGMEANKPVNSIAEIKKHLRVIGFDSKQIDLQINLIEELKK